jgi:hypothetical protein
MFDPELPSQTWISGMIMQQLRKICLAINKL